MRHYKSQLKSLLTGALIASVGGVCLVVAAGGTAKATLYDNAGAALANPFSLSNGSLEFNVADSVSNGVDLYILSPTGHMVIQKGVKASGESSILVDTSRLNTTLVIPFNIANTTAATETSTGFTVPGAVQPNPLVYVTAIDATEDIDVGTLSSDSGDADGFMDGVSVATLGYAKGSLLTSADTMGALLSVQDSANAGDDAPEQDLTMIGKTITYTLSTGSDTAAGFIILPVLLPPTAL